MFRRLITLALVLVFVPGCAIIGGNDQVEGFFKNPRAFVHADAAAALADAEKATDPGAPFRAECWRELVKWIPADPAAPGALRTPVGLIHAYELLAERQASSTGGGLINIPEVVRARCSYVEDEFRRAFLRGALKLSPTPGVGAAGGLLLR